MAGSRRRAKPPAKKKAAKKVAPKRQPTRLPNGLTLMQDKFAQGFALHGNATRAYLEAGYKAQKTIQATNREAFRLPQVYPKLFTVTEEYRKRYSSAVDIRADSILANYGAIGTADFADFLGEDGAPLAIKDMPQRARLAIQQLEVEDILVQEAKGDKPRIVRRRAKLRLHSKVPALDALARIKGLVEKGRGSRRGR